MPRERDEKKPKSFRFSGNFIKKRLFLECSCLDIKPFSLCFVFLPGLTDEVYAVTGVLGRILVLYRTHKALLF